MPHVRPEGLDFVVAAFVVHPREPKVLLVHHRAVGTWLAPGGHVGDRDSYETTDDALKRELLEETGLVHGVDYDVWQNTAYMARRAYWASLDNPGAVNNSRQLLVPWAVEVHDFPLKKPAEPAPLPPLHLHLAFVYLCVGKKTVVRLETEAHSAIGWFGLKGLDDVWPTIRYYGRMAIQELYPRA